MSGSPYEVPSVYESLYQTMIEFGVRHGLALGLVRRFRHRQPDDYDGLERIMKQAGVSPGAVTSVVSAYREETANGSAPAPPPFHVEPPFPVPSTRGDVLTEEEYEGRIRAIKVQEMELDLRMKERMVDESHPQRPPDAVPADATPDEMDVGRRLKPQIILAYGKFRKVPQVANRLRIKSSVVRQVLKEAEILKG